MPTATGSHLKLSASHQDEASHHVVDGVVDSLHHLLFPLSVAVAGSPRTIINVIHIHRPEMSNAFHV